MTKIYYYKHKINFEDQMALIPSQAIVFIEDTKEIYTHGHKFTGEINIDDLDIDSALAAKFVQWSQLDEQIRTVVEDMVPWGDEQEIFSPDFGDSEQIGVTLKKISEAYTQLLNQINTTVANNAEVKLIANPSVVPIYEQSAITLTATTDTEATSIVVKQAPSAVIDTGTGRNLTCNTNVTPMLNTTTINFIAEFTINGITKQATASVRGVYPVKYGAGSTYTDAENVASARTTPAGTYTITVENNEDYVFFVIPANMVINSAKMGGIDFPLNNPVLIAGTDLMYYKSSNSYDAGTLTIKIE